MSAEERKECEKSKERKLQFIEEVEEMTKARQSQRIFQTPTPESRKRMRDEMMDDLQKKGKVWKLIVKFHSLLCIFNLTKMKTEEAWQTFKVFRLYKKLI